jgi:hypothetical protein
MRRATCIKEGRAMIFQVRIYDRFGKLKSIISDTELKRAHWAKFDVDKKRYLLPDKKSVESLELGDRSSHRFKITGTL